MHFLKQIETKLSTDMKKKKRHIIVREKLEIVLSFTNATILTRVHVEKGA